MAKLSKAIDIAEQSRVRCHWCKQDAIFIATVCGGLIGQACMDHRAELWDNVKLIRAAALEREYADMVKWHLKKDLEE